MSDSDDDDYIIIDDLNSTIVNADINAVMCFSNDVNCYDDRANAWTSYFMSHFDKMKIDCNGKQLTVYHKEKKYVFVIKSNVNYHYYDSPKGCFVFESNRGHRSIYIKDEGLGNRVSDFLAIIVGIKPSKRMSNARWVYSKFSRSFGRKTKAKRGSKRPKSALKRRPKSVLKKYRSRKLF